MKTVNQICTDPPNTFVDKKTGYTESAQYKASTRTQWRNKNDTDTKQN
mgnify:CR=1 FL=1